jgi:hypothetical protein
MAVGVVMVLVGALALVPADKMPIPFALPRRNRAAALVVGWHSLHRRVRGQTAATRFANSEPAPAGERTGGDERS